MNKTERAIVLKTSKYGESDLIVRTINSEGNFISFVAKGALKSKKRFVGGVLEPTRFIKVTYRQKHSEANEPLHFLNEASVLEAFDGIRSDYDRLEMSFYFLKVVLKMGQQGLSHAPQLFLLLGQTLRALESVKDLYRLKVVFEAHLLDQQGVCPSDVNPEFFKQEFTNYGQIKWSEDEWRRQAVIVEHVLKNYLEA